jgi:hypothetical protein
MWTLVLAQNYLGWVLARLYLFVLTHSSVHRIELHKRKQLGKIQYLRI